MKRGKRVLLLYTKKTRRNTKIARLYTQYIRLRKFQISKSITLKFKCFVVVNEGWRIPSKIVMYIIVLANI